MMAAAATLPMQGTGTAAFSSTFPTLSSAFSAVGGVASAVASNALPAGIASFAGLSTIFNKDKSVFKTILHIGISIGVAYALPMLMASIAGAGAAGAGAAATTASASTALSTTGYATTFIPHVPTGPYASLLQLIGLSEANVGGFINPDVIYGGSMPLIDGNTIRDTTIGDFANWQLHNQIVVDGHLTTPAGGPYQYVRSTLLQDAALGGIPTSTKMGVAFDHLGNTTIDRLGMHDYMANRISGAEMTSRLRGTWHGLNNVPTNDILRSLFSIKTAGIHAPVFAR